MRKLLLLSLLPICLFACNKENNKPDPVPDTFIRGTDLSFLPEIESYHLKFFDRSGNVKDVLTILKEAGMKVYLTFHFSDTWADPGQQATPAAWQGKNLDSLQSVMSSLSEDFGKPVLIAETSYPFTLGWEDMTNNVIGLQEQLIPAYQASPEGQRDFMAALRETISSSANGAGFCYWGGEWIAFKGELAQNGSRWENQTLFDFENKVLPVLGVFKK